MSVEDEGRKPHPDDPAEGSVPEEDPAPPPATWAGRERAGEGSGGDAPEPGFTEEFDEVGRDLEEELEELDDEDADDDDELELDDPDADLEPADPEAAEPEAEAEEPAAEDEADEPADEAEAENAEEAEEEDAKDDEAAEGEAREPEPQAAGMADRVQAEDAAMAGLRARAAGKGAEPQQTEAAAAVAPADEPDPGEPPRAKPLWARFLAASLLIVISMATATSVSLLLYLTDIARGLSDNNAFEKLDKQLASVEGGDPQTILILGSDERLSEKGVPGRSDTAMLLRVDPDKDALALLSIPRDLKVNIPKLGVDKFNAAYSVGGPKLTLDVVRQLTGLDVNHVVNINFTGFADAVNAIDCVYIDVDRRYFIPPESGYAEIDIEAGYQRLCGFKALQYVRYRLDDNDLVRSARQQDFVREARQKLDAEKIVRDSSYRNKLVDIFTDYTTSDIDDPVEMLELLKTFIGAASATVGEVHFPADLGDGTSGYVTASEDAIKDAVRQFLGVEGTPGARPAGSADEPEQGGEREKPDDKKPKPEPEQPGPPMIDATGAAQQYAQALDAATTKGGDPMVKFPIFYPTRLVPGSAINDATRAFPIDGPEKEKYYGFKFVIGVPGAAGFSEYYGVSGTNWVDAPILEKPSETRRINGRDYQLFYDGDRLRLVGFKTKKASYWVNNTLLQTLDEDELISIATSMRERGE